MGVGFLMRGSNSLSNSWVVWENAVSSPAGFWAEPRPPKGFPLFSERSVASLDTIILLIVDYHTSIGWGKTSVTPLRTPWKWALKRFIGIQKPQNPNFSFF